MHPKQFKYLFILIHFFAGMLIQAQTKNDSLLYASYKGNTELVITLLEDSADVNATTIDGVTSLMYAAQNADIKTIRVLTHNGADVNKRPDDGTTALIAAAKSGDYQVMEHLILNDAKIKAKDNDSANALYYACLNGYYVPADLLLFYGANPNTRTKNHTTALMAAIYSGNTELVDLLLANGADINAQNDEKNSALKIATRYGFYDIVTLLTFKGANIAIQDKYGQTPLATAIVNFENEIALFYIDQMKNNEQADPILNDAVKVAYEYQNEEIIDSLKSIGFKLKGLSFPYYQIEVNNIFRTDDVFLGGSVGIFEDKSKLTLSIGYQKRLFARQQAKKINEHQYFQYWTNRDFFFVDLSKSFALVKRYKANWGLQTSASGLYSRYKYRGLDEQPSPVFGIMPSMKIYVESKYLVYMAGYHYMLLQNTDIPPHYFSLTLAIKIFRRSSKHQGELVDLN